MMICWKAFEHASVTYDLSHVHPYLATFVQPAKGANPERAYEAQIIFSLHCFTRKAVAGDDLHGPLAYGDSRETRIFDFHRYDCSKQLRSIIDALPMSPCYHTDHGNFFTVRKINESTLVAETYEVYFAASRSTSKSTPLNLFVQSAYVRDREHTNRPVRKKISLFVILHNTLHKQPIKAPPK